MNNIPDFGILYKQFLNVRKYHPGVSRIAIEKRTNRHRDLNGGNWGWYEIFPLDITLGYWHDATPEKDDLKDFNIREWNEKTKQALESALKG